MANGNELDRTSRCGTCKFYDPRVTVCRRNPPAVVPVPHPAGVAATSLWPPVDAEREWCGEYAHDQLVELPRGEA